MAAKKSAIDLSGYSVKLTRLNHNDGGGWLAEVPALPGCFSDGETPNEALGNVHEAIKMWTEIADEKGTKYPEPELYQTNEYSGRLTVRLPQSLHRDIAQVSERNGVSINTMIVNLIGQGVGANLLCKEIIEHLKKEKFVTRDALRESVEYISWITEYAPLIVGSKHLPTRVMNANNMNLLPASN